MVGSQKSNVALAKLAARVSCCRFFGGYTRSCHPLKPWLQPKELMWGALGIS